MTTFAVITAAFMAAGLWVGAPTDGAPVKRDEPQSPKASEGMVGSKSCRACHDRFYKLWADSHHGLAMQPFSLELARRRLAPQTEEIRIGAYRYRAEIARGECRVLERGPEGEQAYRIQHAMGGKNIFYFLTPLDRGRLQVLPVAFDVRKKEWFDTTASAIRHFEDREDDALYWKDRSLTFNTACHGCHVSQLSTNYDVKSDTYNTVWKEPGINCETCHGPCNEHVLVCVEAPEGKTPKDLQVSVIRPGLGYTVHQANAACAPCHAKMVPLTPTFVPGGRYFDHFDLTTLESSDFYPDGRDLGENYTYTLWRMSPCVKAGRLDCLHCHTSSGRYRFDGSDANRACTPCHADRVENAAAHTRHPAGSEGDRCVACHMPTTEFARMRRSDHSMRPPAPAATLAFGSPNACNLCHENEDAQWADGWVRKWHPRDYQAPVIDRAALIDAARKHDWAHVTGMLAYLTEAERDEVTAASLIRLLQTCGDERKWPALVGALEDPSPLVRARAAESLSGHFTRETVKALLRAAQDPYRLVRIRVAGALAGLPTEWMDQRSRKDMAHAVAEFETAMRSRPDDPAAHYNHGNFHMDRGELAPAVAAFEAASRLRPDWVAPWVNASLAHNSMGRADKAEQCLRKALALEPGSSAANLNLGLLLGEQGRRGEAAKAFRRVLETDPKSAVAAYNLCVLLSDDRIEEALTWCRRAADLRPDEPKYGYTLAFYLYRNKESEKAARVLQSLIEHSPAYAVAYALLGEIYVGMGKKEEAAALCRRALANEAIPERDKHGLRARLQAILSR